MTKSTSRAVAPGRRGKMDRRFLLGTPGDGVRGTADPSPDTGSGNVVIHPTATSGLVKAVTDESSGKTMLHILTRDADQQEMPPLVQDWHRFGEIGTAFAEAIAASPLNYVSRRGMIDSMGLFLTWLTSRFGSDLPIKLTAIGTDKLLAYRAYLDTVRASDGKPYSSQTKRLRLGHVRTVFNWLQRSSENLGARPDPKLRLPQGIWAAAARQSNPRSGLSEDGLRATLMACTAEIETTMARHQEGLRLVEQGRSHLKEGMDKPADFSELAVVLAAIEAWFPDSAPNLKTITARHAALGYAIRKLHGMGRMSRFLYPDLRTLVPFVVLLTVHTVYNPDTIRGLRLGQIVTNDVFTDQFRFDPPKRKESRARDDTPSLVPKRLRTGGEKGRARRGRVQHRSFRVDPDDAFGAHMTIEHVKVLTSRLRPLVPAKYRDRLFLFSVATGGGAVGMFGRNIKMPFLGDNLWQHALKLFRAEYNLPYFTLSSIRATMAEAAERLTGDLRAVQLLLGHEGCDVTFNHYFTAAGRKRASESVAVAQSMRHRWAETGGRRDVREGSQGDSLMSASPGMDCLDPYDSPMPGQVKGKMCSAWLACFFCPLAAIRRDDGHSFARLVQLEDHVVAAATTIALERYRAAYVPVLRKLREWLERFTPAARQAAGAITYLKPLPELE